VDEQNEIDKIKSRAYTGENGAKRARFVADYTRTYRDVWKRTHDRFFELAKTQQKAVTCKNGCVSCCYQLIQTNLGNALIVVDSLYSNPGALRLFLKNYHRLSDECLRAAREYDEALYKRIREHTLTRELSDEAKALATDYMSYRVPCVFLDDSSCSIYPVRPSGCQGHYSFYPAALCTYENEKLNRTVQIGPAAEDLSRLRSIGPPMFSAYTKHFPTLVYKLLTEGFGPVWERAIHDVTPR
jgi:Fe-S-cluster containining protein